MLNSISSRGAPRDEKLRLYKLSSDIFTMAADRMVIFEISDQVHREQCKRGFGQEKLGNAT